MNAKVVFAILLVGLSVQQCTIGCLKCNSLNQCMLCDITKNYFLNGNTCALSTQTNCNLLSLNGNCVQCNTNFFLDVNSQKCVAVTSTNVVPNCNFYNSGQVCTACNANFFVAAGRCTAVNSTVANCQFYSANGVCLTCAAGFVLSNDRATCVTVPSNATCLYYTYVGCRQCNTGFVVNPNLYFANFNSMPYVYSMYLATGDNAPTDWIAPAQCQATTISNCLVFSAFNFCTQCARGFFLQNGNCVQFPLPVIFGCLTYSTLTTCSQCQSGMYLNQNTCLSNTVIPNCLTYSGSSSTTTCVACNGGFFLQGNTCVNRTMSASIANCQVNSLSSDLCANCTNGFVLTNDARACLAQISNCANYSASTFQTTALQCSQCAAGFYLTSSGSTTVCVAGTVQFCRTYVVNSNTCTACNNGYYLTNNACVAHVTIPNCATYDANRANFCSVCSDGFYNFAYTTVCVQTQLRSGCATYSIDGNSCTTCQAGYWLGSGNCNLIPATYPNCATYSGTQCTVCNAGYMVNTLPAVGTCVLPLDYVHAATNSPCSLMEATLKTATPTWSVSPTTALPILTCGTCGNYMYGYNPLPAEAICVLTTQLTMYSGYTAVANCFRYGLNYATSQQIICMQCTTGNFLSGYETAAEKSTATTCVNVCNLASTASSPYVIVDDMLGFVNICVTSVGYMGALSACTRYGRVAMLKLGQTTLQLEDYQCLATMAGTGTYPTNYFNMDANNVITTNTQNYLFEQASATAQIPNASLQPGVGYAMAVDSQALFPSIFNYKGTLITTAGLATANAAKQPISVSSTAVVAGDLVALNNLSNCDIVASYTQATGGYAALTGSTHYVVVGATSKSCFKCNWGFQLSYTVTGTTAAANSPYPNCVQMQTCSTGSVYGGLTQFLNSILSCHVCNQVNGAAAFPTIWIETDASATKTGAFVGYQVLNKVTLNGAVTTVSDASGFKCAAAPNTVVIGGTGSALTQGKVANCAVYGNIAVMTAVGTSAASTVSVDVCLACAANYWPSYMDTYSATSTDGVISDTVDSTAANKIPRWTVKACTLGANCDTTNINTFNSCGKCRTDTENNVVPTYYAYHDLTFTNCYLATTKNCFVLATSSSFSTSPQSSGNACEICKSGFFINADGACEEFRVPNQSVNGGVFYKAYAASMAYPNAGTGTVTATSFTGGADLRVARMHYALSVGRLQYGVSACSNSGTYTLAPTNQWARRLCVWSSYVYNNTGSFPTNTKFITNCIRYNMTQSSNARDVCGGCSTGFIPTQDGTSCVSTASLPNCVYAQNSNNAGLCFQCAVNFLNVNGNCVSTTIPNCATYVNDLWSFSVPSTLQCSKCIDGFVLAQDNGSCAPGFVSNCIQYDKGLSNKCNACAAGFVLMTLNNNVYYCYPVPATLNCNLLQDTSSNSGANYGTISCAACNVNSAQVFGARNWVALNLNSQPQTLCMPFTTIANCVQYSQQSAIIRENSFNCIQCASGFWFSASNSTCVPRVNMPAQCTNYSLTSDVCTVCASGSFLSTDGRNCVSFPNGIFQCALYSSATTCTQCNPGYYLSSNTCVQSTTINNCVVYSANFTCAVCANGFFLNNATSCITATAANCASYTSASVCASCATGFGLQTNNGVTSCVAVNLANCVNATSVAPFTCLVCNNGYFPNSNGACTLVAQTIANCLTYDSATTCSRCAQNSILNVARTVCNATYYSSLVDPNCNQNFLVAQPTCTQCQFGSFFVNGTCTSCTNNTFAAGCMACDPANNNVCLSCRSGYYMNAQGGCVANNPTPTPTPTPTNNGTSNNTAAVTKAVGVFLAMAVVYFDRF